MWLWLRNNFVSPNKRETPQNARPRNVVSPVAPPKQLPKNSPRVSPPPPPPCPPTSVRTGPTCTTGEARWWTWPPARYTREISPSCSRHTMWKKSSTRMHFGSLHLDSRAFNCGEVGSISFVRIHSPPNSILRDGLQDIGPCGTESSTRCLCSITPKTPKPPQKPPRDVHRRDNSRHLHRTHLPLTRPPTPHTTRALRGTEGPSMADVNTTTRALSTHAHSILAHLILEHLSRSTTPADLCTR
mmetsp:Transcript_11381/g.26503  ORF Transcript_11381/g.26503 Transcript_11381/m.26503 type:complete len:243 (-) Transcript_11381:26-754(-)